MEGFRGRPRKGTVYREGWRVLDRSKEIIEKKERQAPRNNAKEKKHLEIWEGLREDVGIKMYLHRPMDYAKKLKLRFRVGDLDPPERRKRCTSSREEEEVATKMCPCGTTIESRTHIVGQCEVYKEERDALKEGMRKLDVRDVEEFGKLESSEKTTYIQGDRWWPHTAKQDGDGISEQFLCSIWKKHNERPNVGGV